MTNRADEQPRLPGKLITVDGPGGVGKSSAVTRAVDSLIAAGLPVHGTRQPSRAELGELARHGTDTYRGMSLACLCAADRHHQLDTVINARLRARGGHSRFERAMDNSDRESALYTRAVADLQDKGWPVQTVDCTAEDPDLIAARIVSLVHRTLGEKSPVCP